MIALSRTLDVALLPEMLKNIPIQLYYILFPKMAAEATDDVISHGHSFT